MPTPHTATVAPFTNDIKVTSPVDTNVVVSHETNVIAPASTDSLYTQMKGFLVG